MFMNGARPAEGRRAGFVLAATALVAMALSATALAQDGKPAGSGAAAPGPKTGPAQRAADTRPGSEAGGDVLAAKRKACRQDARAKGLRGEEVGDDTAICLAEARLDCTRKAVAAKARGAERNSFVRDCMSK